MTDERRPPPEVTVTDPAAPGGADLLVSHDERPARRRTWIALVAVSALVAAALLLADGREDDRRDRQEADVVDVELLAFARELREYDDGTGTIQLKLLLQLRNEGSRTVTVLRGGLGGYGLDRDVELAPGQTGTLPLTRSVRCGEAPGEPASDELALTLGTSAGPRDVRLPVPFELPGGAARACGFLPLEEAVTAQVVGVDTRRGSLRLEVEVRTVANRPVDVVDVQAVDPGVQALLEEQGGGPVRLPIPEPGGTATARLHVVLRVVDCAAAAALPGAPASRAVRLVVQEPDGGAAQPRVGYDPALLGSLLAQAC